MSPIRVLEPFGPDMFHLIKRFFTSLSATPLNDLEHAWVKEVLSAREHDLWSTQAIIDQRHSCDIARRFVEIRSLASRDEIAGALLHDIGKIDADLGIMARVIVTLLPLPTPRFTAYRNHQQRGAQMLKTIGSSDITIALVAGHPDGDALRALHHADDI
ncbi:MAG: hypothetical protein ACYC06_06500 [Ilumatobacteraceae bacterium]